ncbi:alpha/beta fold hydrolase [Ciceribacter sp. RN22]|uniref:alpha/beta fold hydrolase n=1 Tax=Ciceribacter sp. RN22 TaxID=2954932 RepID=UPI002092E445|nr:alpha/beta fold hydrolase [Ciceribacter sp. RN22]MCO6178326.1 alpha/beta hydrolase [Ciceribacter sp. RN22]
MEKMNYGRAERGIIRSGVFELGCAIEGQGLPVLVIGSSLYYARTFSPGLRRSVRLHFVDHRCFARPLGPVQARDFAFDRIIEDIELARQTFGLERLAILGHSGHGYMALEYARRFPGRVSHVVLAGTGPNQGAELAQWAERRWAAEASPERRAIFDREMAKLAGDIAARPHERFKHLLIRLGARSWFDPGFDARPLWDGVWINDIGFDHLWGEVFREIDMHALARGVMAPALLALGRFDYLIAPPAAWEPFPGDFARLTIEMFEHSGHTMQFEESERFDATLLDFLHRS